jgi:predicted O-linked N-acetylglucosamine transferase (SPINDLY family)
MSSETTAAEQPKNGPPKFLIDAASAVNRGKHDEAIEIFKNNIETDKFIAYSGLGDVYRAKGDYVESFKWLKKAFEHNPNAINVIDSMAQVLTKLNRNDEATDIMCKALQLQKNNLGIRQLAESMRKQGKGKIAAETLEKIIPTSRIKLDVMFELATLYERMLQNDPAEKLYLEILKVVQHPETYYRLGVLYIRTGCMTKAISCLRKGLELLPNNESLLNNLAVVYLKSGKILEATKILEELVKKEKVDTAVHSAYLYHLHLLPDFDPQKNFEAHKEWGIKQAPMSLANLKHNNNPQPNRKLRIGYISPDFRHHSVGYIIEKVLTEHNRDNFEIFGYGNVALPDSSTPSYIKMFSKYRNIYGVNDDAVSQVIREDEIDILIDLAGHSANNRLLVLARKPAPIQVTYLGYFDTTGMPQVDYIITDELVNPPDSQKYYIEKFAYLPGGVCFYNPKTELEITSAPIIKNGYPTFGVFTNNLRFNSKLLQTWAEILKNVPDSKLLIGFDGGDDASVQATFLKDFEKLGVSKNSIRFSGRKVYEEYIKQYAAIDISLDTFPENGGTTICDSLWMGVPVISVYSEHMNGRAGLTILNRVGLGEYAISSTAEYIAKAVELAKNPVKISKLRNSLRPIMKNSRLCDSKKMTEEIESCYRQMWQKWCQNIGI